MARRAALRSAATAASAAAVLSAAGSWGSSLQRPRPGRATRVREREAGHRRHRCTGYGGAAMPGARAAAGGGGLRGRGVHRRAGARGRAATPGLPASSPPAIEGARAAGGGAPPGAAVAAPGGARGGCSLGAPRARDATPTGSPLDTVRAFRGVYEHVPDVVARPRDGRDRGVARVGGGRETSPSSRTAAARASSAGSSRIPARFDGVLARPRRARRAARGRRDLARGAHRRRRRPGRGAARRTA